jgi:hypothetical protein
MVMKDSRMGGLPTRLMEKHTGNSMWSLLRGRNRGLGSRLLSKVWDIRVSLLLDAWGFVVLLEETPFRICFGHSILGNWTESENPITPNICDMEHNWNSITQNF